MTPSIDYETELHNTVSEFYADPLGFVMFAWPWGVAGGPLEHSTGPDENQRAFLVDLGRQVKARAFDGHTPVDPIRNSISSAHGTGKGTIGAWLALWILSTRPMSIGTATAGTFQQLEERTWADISYWGRMCITAHWFDIQADGVFAKDPRLAEKWKLTPRTATADRAQTFAGQHARTSTSWFLFDEASEIPDEVWETAYGGLTDGEPMMFAWGQMIRGSGEFYNVCFGRKSESTWSARVWDGRKSDWTNKKTIKEWEEEYGEDSDYFRVRVLGLPPRASELQFIGQDLVDGARRRVHNPLPDEPLVWGFDAANGGQARFCFWARRGLDASSIPPIFLPGDTPRDQVVAKMVELMSDTRPGRRASALFGDQAFGAVILQRVRDMGYTNVFEVNFGDTVQDKHYGNRRAQMWGRLKEWLNLGAIPDDHKIYQPFMDPGFHHRTGKLYLESKQDMAKRGVKSPDGPDALALTFAQSVAPVPQISPRSASSEEYSAYG
jgi:hypothetical protein